MEAMAQALLKWETIDADQIDDIMAGKPPREPRVIEPPKAETKAKEPDEKTPEAEAKPEASRSTPASTMADAQ